MPRYALLTPEEVWRRYDDVESRLSAPLSERMLDLLSLRPGMRVLDLATGRGEPALRAARRVGPEGFVLGVDVSEGLLAMAREKAEREGVVNLQLRVGKAESLDGVPLAHFHAATVRWGLMYMDAPVAALAAARRALLPGGQLVAALWAEPERVPYFTLPRQLLERYRPLPALDPEGPGTFRYADLSRIERDFQQAGFTLAHVEEMDVPVVEAEDAMDVVAWARALGLTRLLDGLPDDSQRAWEEALAAELERRRSGRTVRLGGVTRIVLAR
jgi:SAM-dependent methyltransferase